MMVDGTMTSKGQITIPKEIREFLALNPGNTIRFVTRNDGMCTMVPMKSGLEGLSGMLPPPPYNGHLSPEEVKEHTRDIIARGVMRDCD
jgi:antitoxin PrlF